MNTVKIEVNGLDITALAEKIDTLANALSGKPETEKPAEPQLEKLLSRIEVCKLLQITPPTVIDWEKKGVLHGYRIGNRVRYKHSEIMQTLHNNKTH